MSLKMSTAMEETVRDNSCPKFPVHREEYDYWAMMMKAALDARGLLDVVLSPVPGMAIKKEMGPARVISVKSEAITTGQVEQAGKEEQVGQAAQDAQTDSSTVQGLSSSGSNTIT